jgi:hypothetical protein
VGSVLDPAFQAFVVEVRPDERGASWQTVGRSTRSSLDDTLAVWDASAEPEGRYVLRVRVDRGSLPELERRIRFVLDRTPPRVSVRFAGAAVRSGEQGVWLDLETDDVTDARPRPRAAGSAGS